MSGDVRDPSHRGRGVDRRPGAVAFCRRVGTLPPRSPSSHRDEPADDVHVIHVEEDQNMTATLTRDYSLTGASRQRSVELGLANAEWFQPAIDPARLRALQQRHDGRAAADVVLWLVLLVGAGVWAYSTVWSWWSIPAFVIYGALHGGAADPRWHECGHGTAFRTRWINDAIYPVASAMLFRGPTVWRWSHYRHHTDTIIVGRDPEIVFQRPPSVAGTIWKFFHIQGGSLMFWRLVKHALGRLDSDAIDFVPQHEHRKVIWESRVIVAVVAAAAAWSVIAWTPLPILFVGGPSIYGAWLMVFFGVTQHAGLRENTLDHRFSTRTVYMNPVFRFLYLNMNYHVEHHIFPSVPYPALPALHDEIRDQLAPPLPNTIAAYRSIFSTLAKQHHDPSYETPLDVPEVPSAHTHRIDVGETNWVKGTGGGVDLGAADALEIGELRRVDVGDDTYVLCRLSADEFALGDGICTHAKVHLADGALVDGQIECPKHNGRFDARTGEAVRKPVQEAICMYPVRRVDGRLVSDLQPSHPQPSHPQPSHPQHSAGSTS
jgi:Na+-transporting NADH:ubiquinone oxidoreductase subunit F